MFPFYFRSNVRFDRYDLDILFCIVTFFIKNIGEYFFLEYFTGLIRIVEVLALNNNFTYSIHHFINNKS